MKKGSSLESARSKGFLEGQLKMLTRVKKQIEFWEAELQEDIRLSPLTQAQLPTAQEMQGILK